MRLSDEVLIFEKNKKVPEVNTLFPPGTVLNTIIPIQGLQIREKAIVESCSSRSVRARVHTIELFCGELESNPILLQSPVDKSIIAGRLKDKDIHQGKIVLTDLRMFCNHWRERSAVRVQPRYPVYFDLQFNKVFLRCNLYDLSVNGAGILVALPDDLDAESLVNSRASFELQINRFLEIPQVTGKVENVRPISKNLAMLGFHMNRMKKRLPDLIEYINFRQQEIMMELRSNLNLALHPPEISGQFF